MKRKPNKRKPTVAQLRKMPLTDTQVDCPANFADHAVDFPKDTFRDAVRFNLGRGGFRGKNAEAYKQACLDAFNLVRDDLIEAAKEDPKLAAKLPKITPYMRRTGNDWSVSRRHRQ